MGACGHLPVDGTTNAAMFLARMWLLRPRSCNHKLPPGKFRVPPPTPQSAASWTPQKGGCGRLRQAQSPRAQNTWPGWATGQPTILLQSQGL